MADAFDTKVRISAIDRLSAVIDKIKGKFPELENKALQATSAFDKLSASTKKFTGAADKIGGTMKSIGQGLTVAFTLPFIAMSAYSVKAFADYETALIGVGKTSDIQGAALQSLGKDFLEMSKRIPVSAVELMNLGKTAAQLGVRGGPDILKFSETLAKLATATDIVGEEGATDLARFMKITGTSLSDVDKVGSALVALGNTSAATESEILSFSTRLAGTTALFGFSAPQVLGYATAMKSLGIEAEAGSSSIQRMLGSLNEAINKGGLKANVLSKLTGIPLDQLKGKFKSDSAGVLRDFAAGLGRVAERGGDVSQALQFFGADGVRDIAVIGTLSKKTEELDRAMRTAADGVSENTALNKEFGSAMQALQKKFDLVKNKVMALFISLGERLAPAALAVLGAFEGIVDFFDAHPWLATLAFGILGVLAVIGPLLIAFGTLITTGVALYTAYLVASGVLAVFGLTVGGATLAVLGFTASLILIPLLLAGVLVLAYKLGEWLGEAIGGWDQLADGIMWVIEKIEAATMAMAKFLGLDKISDKAIPAQQKFGSNGAPIGMFGGPQGAPIGGTEAKSQVNPAFSQQTNNARVEVMVRAPESTKVKSESDNPFFSLSRGPIGIFP